MIKVILWDVDGTLLDFKKAEYAAIKKCFEINVGFETLFTVFWQLGWFSIKKKAEQPPIC